MWMAATAVVLAVFRATDNREHLAWPKNAVEISRNTCLSILSGACLASLGAFAIRYWRRVPVLRQPGHLLLLVYTFIVFRDLGSEWLDPIHYRHVRLVVAFELARLISCAGGLVLLNMEWRWRSLFAWLAAIPCLYFVVALYPMLAFRLAEVPNPWSPAYLWSTIIFLAAIIALGAVDIFTKSRRDWLHWVGVSVVLALQVFAIANSFYLDWRLGHPPAHHYSYSRVEVPASENS